MSRRWVGLGLLLVASLAMGTAAGHRFYTLYAGSIPEALKATTSMRGTYLVFLFNGLGLGVACFVGALIVVALSPFFRGAERTTPVAR